MSNRDITLASGTTIQLRALRQWSVYGGLLEGLPTRKMNAATLQHIRDEARKRTQHEPFVIEPVETAIEYEGRYPFGEPARLPSIACVGDFIGPGMDPIHCSCLTVIWFQDDYAFPLSAPAQAELVALDWQKLAKQEEL